ncbi:Molybdopterin synthase catalytic subunit 1 [Planctomycetes bacterium Pla163]|uniref:Molybdopterin synthase catalytic subunit n=1 Tax=Rohdeia mirabilis TaxID=2528008 RepID=A0A518D105_9BACT|nr:Molybdopterin synthase catalytic subunit 1 [Planctomycetes bacterium Pla163]
MRCTVEFFAGLRERAGRDRIVIEDVPDGLTVAAFKRLLVERHPELGTLDGVRAVLGTAYVDEDTTVPADATVHLLPPVSGGQGEPSDDPAHGPTLEEGVFELSATALDPARALARVGDPGCGGNVLFTGTTRGRNRERDVDRLDYEAFDRMCGPEMARIFERCLATCGPPVAQVGTDPAERRLRMLVQHRSGVVEVGEPSVVVAVASPHRNAAFEAARFLIDALKESLPVWKRECYSDGHHWIGEGS